VSRPVRAAKILHGTAGVLLGTGLSFLVSQPDGSITATTGSALVLAGVAVLGAAQQKAKQARREQWLQDTRTELPVASGKKHADAVPLATAPSVTGGTAPSFPGLTPEQSQLRAKLADALKRREPVVLSGRTVYVNGEPCTVRDVSLTPAKSTAVPPLYEVVAHVVPGVPVDDRRLAELEPDEPEDEYVPAGQEELSAGLLEHLRAQVREVLPRQKRYDYPHKGCWVMSPEWEAEVRRLRGRDGRPVWGAASTTLFGYLVKVGVEYGVPELNLDA